MAVDGTSIKNDIDNNLANKGYRGVRVVNVITALKNVIDWVSTAVSSNVSTWLRISDNQPGGANGDGVYRTGMVQFRGGMHAKTTQANNNPLATTGFGNNYGLMIEAAQSGGPAWMEFHVPGVVIHQLGVDTDGVLKLRPFSQTSAYPVVIDGSTPSFRLATTTANRKVALYDSLNNDHQFYGFGINPDTLRYQVLGSSSSHVFYAGTSPATSKELTRIGGDGLLGHSGGFRVSGAAIPSVGVGLELQYGALAGIASIYAYDRGASQYKPVYLDGSKVVLNSATSGYVGTGTDNPAATLHVKGVTGHQQFLLEKPYTPTGVSDPNGQVGQVCWDASYIYVKVAAGQWRRASINGGW